MEKIGFRIGAFSATDEWVDGMHYLKIYRDGYCMPIVTIPTTSISPESLLSEFLGWLNGSSNIVSDIFSCMPDKRYYVTRDTGENQMSSIRTIVSEIEDYKATYDDHVVGVVAYNDDGRTMRVADAYLDEVLFWIDGWDSDMYAALHTVADVWRDVE